MRGGRRGIHARSTRNFYHRDTEVTEELSYHCVLCVSVVKYYLALTRPSNSSRPPRNPRDLRVKNLASYSNGRYERLHDTQGWRDSECASFEGAGKSGSTNAPTATAIMSGLRAGSQ